MMLDGKRWMPCSCYEHRLMAMDARPDMSTTRWQWTPRFWSEEKDFLKG
jgi:hypothetical protein